MKKFFNTRLGLYLIYGILFHIIWWIGGFQSAVGMFLIYTLAEIEFSYSNKQVVNDSNEKTSLEPIKEIIKESPWIELKKELPPHEVVLAACDTSDCGWVVHSAWWNKKENCWMLTGNVTTEYAHLPYTHWRRMPKGPDGE